MAVYVVLVAETGCILLAGEAICVCIKLCVFGQLVLNHCSLTGMFA